MGNSTVMLSTFAPLSVNSAKHLSAKRDRSFVSLRACPERSEWGDSVGADLSALGRFPDIPMKKLICIIAPTADLSACTTHVWALQAWKELDTMSDSMQMAGKVVTLWRY